MGEFIWRYQVAFAETDMAGIVHFSNYMRYMEMAEHAMFRSMGHSIHEPGDHALRWPRVHVTCDYKKPLIFEDEVEVHLFIKKRGKRSIEYFLVLKKVTHQEEVVVATGRMIVVCCQHSSQTGRITSIPIPEALANKLTPAPLARYAPYLDEKGAPQ